MADEPFYEVSHILAARTQPGARPASKPVRLYLLRWKGWGPSNDTWERAEQFAEKSVVADFEAGLAAGPCELDPECTRGKGHGGDAFGTCYKLRSNVEGAGASPPAAVLAPPPPNAVTEAITSKEAKNPRTTTTADDMSNKAANPMPTTVAATLQSVRNPVARF